MRGLFGVVQHCPIDETPGILTGLRGVFVSGADQPTHWSAGGVALGGLALPDYHTGSRVHPSPLAQSADSRHTALAWGRVDNRADLAATLSLPPDHTLADLALHAFRRWGRGCTLRLAGDWVCAVWDSAEQTLFLARDPYGYSALYYLHTDDRFAFATSRKALLTLAPAWQMDEWLLAQLLIGRPGDDGSAVFQRPLRRLPPAHWLTLTPQGCTTHRYWQMEGIGEQPALGREESVERARALFDAAVQKRLDPNRPIAVSLSGGLDSTAVAATAAHWLAQQGRTLTAFTAVPHHPTQSYTRARARFGNELELARLTAEHAGNIEFHPVTATEQTPIAALHEGLALFDEPLLAAQNLFWSLAINRRAAALGESVLLSGNAGNLTLSWSGDVASQPWRWQISQVGWRTWGKKRLFDALPERLARAWLTRPAHLARFTAARPLIHPDFARRIQLIERLTESRLSPFAPHHHTGLQQRLYQLQPGNTPRGAIWADFMAAWGLEPHDPTADLPLLTFLLTVPDRHYLDPATDTDRWLIRAVMAGRLPEFVRLVPFRGRQSADLVPRLRESADEVEATLAAVARGPAAGYLNLAALRDAWHLTQREDTPAAFDAAGMVLMRGLMAGLAVNRFSAEGR
jgi:asparagine synthase (glutamine-hydrolysing)